MQNNGRNCSVSKENNCQITSMGFAQAYLFSAETYAEDLKGSGSHDWCRERKGRTFGS